MRDDAQLLHAFVTTRSEDAFKELVLAHIDPVYSVAVRVLNGDSALAQDVTQTVFADFARKAASIRNGSAVGAWLCRRAFFVASSKVREERRRRQRERDSVCMNAPSANEAGWEEIKGVVDEFVQTLPAADREAVTLRFLHGWELKRVGSALGISDDAAQKRVGRALEKLRRGLAQRGFTISAAGLLTAISSQGLSAAPFGLAAQTSAAVLSGTCAGSGLAVQWLAFTAHLQSRVVLIGLAGLAIGMAILSITFSGWLTPNQQAGAGSVMAGPIRSARFLATVPEVGATPFHWSQIEAADFGQLAANLRAIGCPEQTVRDILIGRLNRAFVPRMQAIWNPGPVEYWKASAREGPSKEQTAELKKVGAEKWALLKAATGLRADSQEIVDLVYLQVNEIDSRLAFLPEERREPARRALRDSGVAESLANARPDSDGREHFAEEMKVVEGVLSVEELAEYRLRNSPRAQWLRNDMAYFPCTREEFTRVLDLIDRGLADKPDHLAFDRQATIALIKSVFGEARAREYERVSDHGYLNARRQADRAAVPPDLADLAGQISAEARLAVERVAGDKSLIREQKLKQIEEIQLRAEQSMRAALGEHARPSILDIMNFTLGNTASVGLH